MTLLKPVKEWDESDEFVRELQGHLSNVFSARVELFCALDMSVIRARYWSRAIPLSGTRRAHSEVIEKEMHKPCQCRCWTHKVKRHARIEVVRFGYYDYQRVPDV